MTMDADAMGTETTDQVSASPLHFARRLAYLSNLCLEEPIIVLSGLTSLYI